jgi:peroxiredoxin (alkyl hydroperoxide reductase subunit C)
MSLQIGQPAPGQDLELQAYDRTRDGSDQQFSSLRIADYRGKWVCLYFYPLDFTFVCPTEIMAFDGSLSEFETRGAVLLAASTDSVYCHLAWCESHKGLQHLKHLMIGDTNHQLSRAFGVLDDQRGVALRGTFLIDPNGVLRWLSVYDVGVGRNVDEVLRVLDALQTDKLCPCNWKPGEGTLN